MSFELVNVSFSYDPQGQRQAARALSNASLKVEGGEFCGIMGRTGCGKSTLVQLVAGLLAPNAGRVLVDGADINAPGYDRRTLRRSVGVVFQYPETQLFAQSVEKDVGFGLNQLSLCPEDRRERIRWALSCMGFTPDDVLGKHPLGLSGGERRRVAIAGVLAVRPSLLMLDEPVAGLDPSGRRTLMELLATLNAEGTTVVMVSHNADCLADYARRIIVMDAGGIVADGSPAEVFRDVEALRELDVGVSQARALASALETAGILAGDASCAVTYGQLLDALAQRAARPHDAVAKGADS